MPVINYNLNIPAANNKPSSDQPLMQVNTNSVNTWVGIDHLPFSDPNAGYHNIAHFPPQVADPGVIANVGQLYTKTSGGDVQLFYEDSSGNVRQITNGTTGFSSATNGYVYLFGNIIMQWGYQAAAASGTPINFNIAFSSPAYFVQLTVANNNTAHRTYVSTNGVSTNQFTPILLSTNGTPESDDIFWMSIGAA